jgi:hypothetical protein
MTLIIIRVEEPVFFNTMSKFIFKFQNDISVPEIFYYHVKFYLENLFSGEVNVTPTLYVNL